MEVLVSHFFAKNALQLKSHKIQEEPKPEIEHSPPGVTHALGIDARQQAGANVVADLRRQILLE